MLPDAAEIHTEDTLSPDTTDVEMTGAAHPLFDTLVSHFPALAIVTQADFA